MVSSPLQTTAEPLEKDRVKLRVEVAEAALAPAIDAAYKRWAKDIKVAGFRQGKVPRQIIDARLGGPEVIREEALRDALPDFYRDALRSEEIEPIAPPDIDVVTFEAGAPLVFEATVDVRPEIPVPDLSTINVEASSAEVTDEDVNEQLERLRDRFAELETTAREARRGDHVLIDLKGYHHDQPVEGASAPDYLYEVGSRTGPPRLDDELEGARPGAILKFSDTMPAAAGELAGQQISFTVLVKEVKAKKLPQLDDEFAKTVGEFDTLDELKDDLRERLSGVKRQMAEEQTKGDALEKLIDAADFTAPEKLVEAEFNHRLEHFEKDLADAGLSMDEYVRQTESTELQIRSDIRSQTARSVKAELLLEEIARRRQIDVTEEDIGREVAIAAARAQRDPKEVAEQLVSSGRLSAVAADIMRRKALDHVVDEVNVIGLPAGEETAHHAVEASQ